MPAETLCAIAEPTNNDLRDVPLDVLCAEARAQEDNYVNRRPSQDAAGVELFRRAIDDADDGAWVGIIEVYRGLLLAHSARQLARGLVVEDNHFLVDRAFQRFWQATRARGMHQFTDLASILKYLKMCLASVLLDEARAQRRQPTTSIEDIPPDASLSLDPVALVVGSIARHDLWRTIELELRDADEQLVARLSFAIGLTPREILARHPDRFDDIAHVYRLKRNIVDRLRRGLPFQRLMDVSAALL